MDVGTKAAEAKKLSAYPNLQQRKDSPCLFFNRTKTAISLPDHSKYGLPDKELDEILELISQGNEAAFTRLLRHYWNKVYTQALTYLHSSELAQELTQDIFLKIWHNRAKLPGLESLLVRDLKSVTPIAKPLSSFITAMEFMQAVRIGRTEFDQLVAQNKVKTIKKERKIYVPVGEVERYFKINSM